MKRVKLLVLAIALYSLFAAHLYSQVDTAWVRRYNGPADNNDNAIDIAVDQLGNVYVTGSSYGSHYDYLTIKYNSNGDTLWTRRYNGTGDAGDYAYAMALDNAGNVYVTGQSAGAGTQADYATIKYNSVGDTIWTRRYNGPGNSVDVASAIAVDASGNVYVTGSDTDTINGSDYVTIKYNSNGDVVWLQRYNGPGNAADGAVAIAIDTSGNIYVTGASTGLASLDDYATIKYNSSGVQQWIARYNGPANNSDKAKAIKVDRSGNIYVTGQSFGSQANNDYLTIKYNPNGDTVWTRQYNGPGNSGDFGTAMAIDNSGNVYITGRSYGVGTGLDIATVKYSSTGNQEWVTRYNGSGNYSDAAYAIALDVVGNIYVTGATTSAGNNIDYATIKYSATGVEQWVRLYNGVGSNSDLSYAIAVNNAGNVYITGQSYVSSTNGDYATIKYVQSGAVEEVIENCKLKIENYLIYPNPARTYFTVRNPLAADRISIYDVSGKIVKEIARTQEHSKEVKISTDGIKNGVYFVKIDNENKVAKIIIFK